MKKALPAKTALLAALFLASPAFTENTAWETGFKRALAQARSDGRLIFLDLSASWCYSCYYMHQRVLDKASFREAAAGLVLVKEDVDKKEGRGLKKKYGISYLPTYLILDHAGRELGRLVGERPEKEFLERLKRLLAATRSVLLTQEADLLQNYLQTNDLAGASAFVSRLPQEKIALLNNLANWQALTARLELKKAIQNRRSNEISQAFRLILEKEAGCELAYDLDGARKALLDLALRERLALWQKARPALERLIEKKVFIGKELRCADFRSSIQALLNLYQDLGLTAEQNRLVLRTIKTLREDAPRVGLDRNRDDDLRFFLELAKDDPRVRELYPQLIKQYPAEYVYYHRFARYLQEHQEPARALELAKKARELCYGANCLAVARVQAKALAMLGLKKEAADLLKRTARENKKQFPEDADALLSLEKEL
ncbi:MAG: thioredoxin family protein [Elusimicrobia bacterium]|nr:thioredoxin family protein [Elusimicrobiota bacterium]